MSIFREIVTRQQVLGLTSMRPAHQSCLAQERLQIARARLTILRHADPKLVLSIRVDEVWLKVRSITYRDLATVLPPPGTAVHQRPSSSQTQVFRVKFVDRPQHPGG